MNFLYENNLPKDLKSKRSVATWQPSHDSPFIAILSVTGPCEGLRLLSKQIKFSRSLENTENYT